MKIADKIQQAVSETAQTAGSLLKVALMSRRASKPKAPCRGTLIVMGNGPSLRDAIDNHRDVLERHPLMSVNFAPITPDFFELRPQMHILADGVFFAAQRDSNMERFWNAMEQIDWDMQLFIPTRYRKSADLRSLPANIRLRYYNLTPVEGNRRVANLLYSKGLGMPRPRNVLIPAIMEGLRAGYREIAIIGADHSWSRTLWVNDNNRVVTVQPHFYKDNEQERERVESLYKDIRLHQIYESFAIAFRSYFGIKDYADSIGARIVNATPESFIDAFPRVKLADLS